MADTIRNMQSVLTLLADNTSGAISPQDLRGAVVSLDDTGWAVYVEATRTLRFMTFGSLSFARFVAVGFQGSGCDLT